MKYLFHFIITLLTIFGISGLSQAQVIGIQEISSANFTLNECGTSDTLAVEIFNCCSSDTLTNIILNDTLPSNISLVSVVAHPNVSAVDVSNPSIPVISINQLVPGQKDTLYIILSAECGAKAAATTAFCGYHISWIDIGTAYSQEETGSNFYSAIRRPNLQLLAVGQVNYTNATLGDSYCRTWKLQNSGLGSTLDSLTFTVSYQDGIAHDSMLVNGVAVLPSVSGDSIKYVIAANLRNVGVYAGDIITIQECFTVQACLDNFGTSTISARWGCSGSVCQEKSRISIVRLSSAIPHISPKTTYSEGCYGSYDTLIVELVNTGGFTASNVQFDVATGYNNYVTDRSTVASFIDTSSFQYYAPHGTPIATSASQVQTSIYSKSFFPIANHPYRAFVDLPEILAGDTLYFRALIYRGCIDEASCGSYHSIATNYDISFSKECVSGANYSLPARVVANHEGKRGGGEIDGPTDLQGGDTATFKFCFTSISANNFDLDRDNGYLRIVYEMPTGLSWTGDTSDLDLTNESLNSSMSPDSLFLDHANNKLHIFYDYSHPIARQNRREYCITPQFFLDCDSPGASGGTNTLSVEALDNFKPNCATNCESPFICPVNFSYNAHCPAPCVRGGYNPSRAYIQRVNLGLPDNDEDGFPDASGSIDLSEIEIDRVVAKDTFMLTYSGDVVRGVASPDTFRYGYGTTKFPNNGNLITYHRAEVEIYDASTMSHFTVSNVPASVLSSGGDRTFVLNYSPGAGTAGYPANYFFDDGDSITIKAQFIFNSNVSRTSDLVNVVENFYYLSHYANPTSDSAKYRCDRWNAKLKTTDAYFTVWSPEVDVVNGCNEYVARYRSYLSIGECCSNYSTSSFFKKEYRAFAITDSLRVFVPAGFQIDSANLRFDHGAAASKAQYTYRYDLSPSRISGDTAVFFIGDLFTSGSGTVLPSRGGFIQYLFVHYRPTCAVPPNVEIPRKYDIFLKGVNTWEGYDRQWLDYGTGNVKFVSPILSISNQGSVVSDGANRVISWDVKIQNDASSAVANEAWLGFARAGTNVTVDSVLDLAADTLLAVSNGIFKAGTLLGGGSTNSRSFRAYAVFSSCTSDSIMAYGGWDCNTYPTSLSTEVCNIDSTMLIVNPVTAILQIDTLEAVSASVDMCEELEFIMSVSQRDLAAAYDNVLDVKLPRGFTLVTDSSYIHYKGDGSKTWFNPINVGSTVKRFNVSGNVSTIGTNGISDFANAPQNEYQLRVLVAIDCDFESGSKIEFEARGTAPCGATLEAARYVQQIKINGAPAITCQVPEINLEGDTLWGCDDSLAIRAVYHNFDTTASSVGHKFRVTLPAGFSYIPASSAFTRNAFSTSEPVISYTFGQQVLNWSSSGNTPAKDSSVWTFDVTSGSSSCGTLEIVADITEDFVATCVADGAICSSTSIVNSISSNIISAKADIVFGQCQQTLIQDTVNMSRNDSLILQIQLRNLGTFVPGNIAVNVFQDMNGNGVIDAGDVMRIDTTLGSIHPQSAISQTLTLSAPNQTLSCEMLVRVVPECACTDTVVTSTGCNFAFLPVAISRFVVTKNGEREAQLSWTTHTEVNAKEFVIQRSTDGSTFEPIGSVAASGNSVQNLNYSFRDMLHHYTGDVVYYRIQSVDFDGTVYYTDAKYISISRVNVVVHPNPAQHEITVKVDLKDADISIADMAGQELYNGPSMGTHTTIPISHLRNGCYILSVYQNGIVVSQKRMVVAR